MCLGEKLTINIKIKSRSCELFVLKKSDFLRVSVEYKEYIDLFLKESLFHYLQFEERKKQMIQEAERIMEKKHQKKKKKEELNEKVKGKIDMSDAKTNTKRINLNLKDEKNKISSNISNEIPNIDLSFKKASLMPNNINTGKKDNENNDNEIDSKGNQFNEKINRIIEALKANKTNFESLEEDPLELLEQLKKENSVDKKKIIINKINKIFTQINQNL